MDIMKMTFEKCLFYVLILFFVMFIGLHVCFASTYTNDNNLFENSYSNNLIDMANSQINNFVNQKYVIFVNNNNYYLVSSNDYTISNNSITFTNSNIISAIRVQNNYNYYYDYNVTTESSTTINVNYIILSNIDFEYSVTSSRFNNYHFNKSLVNIGIFTIGLLFAIFLSKERRI